MGADAPHLLLFSILTHQNVLLPPIKGSPPLPSAPSYAGTPRTVRGHSSGTLDLPSHGPSDQKCNEALAWALRLNGAGRVHSPPEQAASPQRIISPWAIKLLRREGLVGRDRQHGHEMQGHSVLAIGTIHASHQ